VTWSATPYFEEVRIEAGNFMMGSLEGEEGHCPFKDLPPELLAQYGLYPTWTNETQQQVTLTKNFIMSAQPVSQVLYKEVTGMNPSLFNMEGTQDEVFLDEWPVDSVNWYEAVEFCNKLSIRDGYDTVYTITGRNPATGYPISSATVAVNWNKNGYRLPTEAEWEYACRAGTETAFNFAERSYNEDTKEYGARTGVWGSDYIWEDWANFIGVDFEITDDNYLIIYGPINYNGRATAESLWYQTVPGFMFADSPNKWDLFLMHGTVEEWCWDRGAVDINGDLIDYGTADQENPEGATTGNNRITRGGSFFDYPIFVRSASRNIYLPTTRMQGSSHNGLPWVGFRIVRNADGSSARAKAAHDAESQTAKQARILLQSIRKHDKNYASLKLERQAFRRKVLGE
jgi:formylglycine-generating enzyme required for sulfatase activity